MKNSGFNLFVPVTRLINGHPLTGDIELTLADLSGGSVQLEITELGNTLTGLNAIVLTSSAKLATIEEGATAGATWGTDLGGIPSFLADTAPDNSLAITGTFMGFHATGSNWPIRFANESEVGKFYVGNGSTKYLSYASDSGILTFCGGTFQTAATGYRTVINDNSLMTIGFYDSDDLLGQIYMQTGEGATFMSIMGHQFFDTGLCSMDGSITIPTGSSYQINGTALAPGDIGAAPAFTGESGEYVPSNIESMTVTNGIITAISLY